MTALERPIQTIPYPWVDLNPLLQRYFLGVSFGISADLLILSTGFILPLSIILSMFIGAISIYVVGNWYLVTQGITYFSQEYRTGMSISLTWQRSMLFAWAVPFVGLSVAAGICPLLHRPKILVNAFKSLFATGKEAVRERKLIILAFAGFLAASISSVVIVHYLVPGFPIWILFLLSTGWSLVYVLIAARSMGETGVLFDVPYVNYMMYKFSGYPKIDIYFAPLTITTSSGAGWCGTFFICDDIGLPVNNFIKLWLIAAPISILMGFFYVASFWRMAPMPSGMYTGLLSFWPVQAAQQALWLSRSREIFNPLGVLGGFLVGVGIYFTSVISRIPLSLLV